MIARSTTTTTTAVTRRTLTRSLRRNTAIAINPTTTTTSTSATAPRFSNLCGARRQAHTQAAAPAQVQVPPHRIDFGTSATPKTFTLAQANALSKSMGATPTATVATATTTNSHHEPAMATEKPTEMTNGNTSPVTEVRPRTHAERAWWKESVVYQIYPASFKDSNDDGWGDVPGIISKLDYLKDLGVDVVWLSPIYKSPQVDMGYDISDYEDIDPQYGTLEDVDRLIRELKNRGMKLMMDLVVNHTSDQHSWFKESRSSKDSPKRDWYIWKPAKYVDGERRPPNNWASILREGHSAWTWDENTQEYYLSLFTPEQPDLNWENPEVREAVHNILRFWLNRGVSGFRMDVINLISKDQRFPDAEVVNPYAAYQSGDKYFANGPRLHEYLLEMRHKVLSHYNTITVGEMPFVRDESEILRAVHCQEGSLNMIFVFDLVDIDTMPGESKWTMYPWDARDLKRINSRLQRMMIDKGGWNSVFVENHDNPRSVSRYTDDSPEMRDLGAKLLAIKQICHSGTIYVYQGEELGMRNVPPEWGIEEYRDVESIDYYKKIAEIHQNNPDRLELALQILQKKARDNARTPVQWDDSPHAGFTSATATPWMSVNPDYRAGVNAAHESKDPTSVLHFWRRALAFRKQHKDVFVYGDYELLDPEHRQVYAFRRYSTDDPRESYLVLLNFSGQRSVFRGLGRDGLRVTEWVMGNYEGRGGHSAPEPGAESVELLPWEGLVGRCA